LIGLDRKNPIWSVNGSWIGTSIDLPRKGARSPTRAAATEDALAAKEHKDKSLCWFCLRSLHSFAANQLWLRLATLGDIAQLYRMETLFQKLII
jgi:hypothetical protein